ncbi:hypothetical protein HMPREF0027_0240 [Actinobacillus ureae ATCC 25976]|uniref:Uncharacterized protein n=1 Tax=Actinobacillus ureae ATCC 25976 TaxID=887324 RepID=E8KEH3_9PAST|nr:hypothetical protein HMPREF0027_0240 [Actinobacillus ureae ATCC 25976]
MLYLLLFFVSDFGGFMAVEGASQLTSVVALLGAAIIAVPIFKRIGLGSVLGYLAG